MNNQIANIEEALNQFVWQDDLHLVRQYFHHEIHDEFVILKQITVLLNNSNARKITIILVRKTAGFSSLPGQESPGIWIIENWAVL